MLEGKIDNLGGREPLPSFDRDSVSSIRPVHSPELVGGGNSDMSVNSNGAAPSPAVAEAVEQFEGTSLYRYSPSVRDMIAWPAVQEMLEDVLPASLGLTNKSLGRDGVTVSPLLNFQEMDALPTTVLPVGSTLSPVLSSQMLGNNRVMTASGNRLAWETMQTLSTAFFETFNLLNPIVDRQHFLTTILPTILTNGLDDSAESTMAYLIFALGEVAVAGTLATATIDQRDNSPMPGLLLFNEARRRTGFHLATVKVSTMQILALTGIFYSSTFHHAEFWHSMASASLACQALITASRPEELTSDILRRVFWYCSIMETFLELELGLPATGLNRYENRVPVPDFSDGLTAEDHVANQASHFQEHFASQIVLRRLSTEFHAVLGKISTSTTVSTSTTMISCTQTSGNLPPNGNSSIPETIKPLVMQLSHWRETLLPAQLHWPEDEPESLPGVDRGHSQSIRRDLEEAVHAYEATPPEHRPKERPTMFNLNLNAPPTVSYPYAWDVQVALLRSRYYSTKHIIHRPFLYKALHHPKKVTQQDVSGIATCLRACLRWPIAMAPVCSRKRMVPCVFFWTENLLGVLLVLWMSERVEVLRLVRQSKLCGERFEDEAAETVRAAVAWFRDLNIIDGQARRAWDIIKALYGLDG